MNLGYSRLIYLALRNVAHEPPCTNLYSYVKMKLSYLKTCKNETKVIKLRRNMYTKNM